MTNLLEDILNKGMNVPKLEKPVLPSLPNGVVQDAPITPAPANTRDDYFRSEGWNQEQINDFNNYNALKHGSAVDYFNKFYTKPAEPNEKKIRNAQTVAGIGDALGLISQMVGADKGAHIRNRDYEQSASARLEKNRKELENDYQKRLDDYNRMAYGAAMSDYGTQLQHSRYIFNAMRQDWKQKQNRDLESEIYKRNRTDQLSDIKDKRQYERDLANDPEFLQNKLKIQQVEADIANKKSQRAIQLAKYRLSKKEAEGKAKEGKIDYTKLAGAGLRDGGFLSELSDEFFEIVKDRRGNTYRKSIKVPQNVIGAAYYDYLTKKNAEGNSQNSSSNVTQGKSRMK